MPTGLPMAAQLPPTPAANTVIIIGVAVWIARQIAKLYQLLRDPEG